MSFKANTEYTNKHVNFACTVRQRELIEVMSEASDITPSQLMRKIVDEEFIRMSQSLSLELGEVQNVSATVS